MSKKSLDRELAAMRAQSAYRTATELGAQLETVSAKRPPALSFEAASRLHLPAEIRSLTANLFEARRHGSRFLSAEECIKLKKMRAFWPEPSLVAQALALREPWQWGVPAQHSRIILFDARTLQPSVTNGTKKHARALLDMFLESIPAGYDIAFLTAPDLPELDRDVARSATVAWRPALIGDVDVFVQLATISYASDPVNVDLLRAPWITRVSVFLDDIQGIYPAHFAGTELLFWLHQLAIEKLRTSDIVLPLGATSLSEATRLWASREPGIPQPVFITTSCLRSLPDVDAPRTAKSGNELLVFGNYHPHKNLALVAAGVGVARENISGSPKVTFLAELSPAQRNALVTAASDGAGTSQKDSMVFAAGLSDEALARRVQGARAVIVPSLHEGFSIPVIDAIGLGAPVLLSRIAAHQELLPEGPWFFDPEDAQSLIESLLELERSGREWPARQAAGLAENYAESTMRNAINRVLEIGLVDASLRAAQSSPDVESNPASASDSSSASASDSSSASASASTVPENAPQQHPDLGALAQRDSAYVSAILSMLDPDLTTHPHLNKPLTLFKNEHDNVVAQFHASTTWRVGRAVLTPVAWLKTVKKRWW